MPERCERLDICIEDSASHRFVSSAQLRTYLSAQGISIVNTPMESISCRQIEEALLTHPMISHVACYKSPYGTLKINVRQRTPFYRVMGDENYFVDTQRQRMPVRTSGVAKPGKVISTASYVPIVTGHVSRQLAEGELFDFIQWLNTHNYSNNVIHRLPGGNLWSDQIVQIHVASPQRIELIMRQGNATIVLGSLERFEQKLNKLRTLYHDGFDRIGWPTDYREIDLRFRDQVVCRR